MKKRGISIAAISIACVFVVTIAAFAAYVYSDYKAGAASAASKFERLSSCTAETSGIYPSGSKEFIDAFNSAINTPNIYEQLRLEVDGIEVYLYPSMPSTSPSVFVKSFSTRIVGGDGAKIQLSANIYALSPSMIFYRAKIAFIIILAGTLACCILLMYVYLSEAEEKNKSMPKIDNDFAEEDEDFEEPFVANSESHALDSDDIDLPEEENLDIDEDYTSTDIEETKAEEPVAPAAPVEKSAPTETVKPEAPTPAPQIAAQQQAEPQAQDDTELDFDNLDNGFDEPKAESKETFEEPAIESLDNPSEDGLGDLDISPIEDENDEGNGEQGLFSKASGFGWESYLDERLESELVRAASSEQDLSLVMIKIPGINSKTPCYKNICKALLDFFQFKDYIFEYKDDGFAALIQNKDVDSAMESAESLYANLVSILNKAGQKVKPLMGISSRSLRLITVDRLKTEAEQALMHASEDSESPIVAFRVNPEKYRQFINQN